jgi:hypothetical protein
MTECDECLEVIDGFTESCQKCLRNLCNCCYYDNGHYKGICDQET